MIDKYIKLLAISAFLLLTILKSASATKLSPGCGHSPRLVSAKNTQTPLYMTVNHKRRNYFVRLPPNYDKNHPYRLIYTLHARGGDATKVVDGTGDYLPWYGLPPLANDSIGAVYVAPNGLHEVNGTDNGWANAGGEDITFIEQMNDVLSKDLCIDENLRFSTGFSWGGAMSYEIACTLAKDFRAVAVLSGNPNISGPCVGGTDPIGYYAEHGVSDPVLPIADGRLMRDQFVRNNNCTYQTPPEPAPGSGKHIRTEYTGCAADYPVTWLAFDGVHTAQPKDAGSNTTFAPAETWRFFSQFK